LMGDVSGALHSLIWLTCHVCVLSTLFCNHCICLIYSVNQSINQSINQFISYSSRYRYRLRNTFHKPLDIECVT
jgi:hypothetical protein